MICFGAVVDGVEGLMLGALESEMLEDSLLGLADILEDFYMVSTRQSRKSTARRDIRNPISRASHSFRSYFVSIVG